MSLVSVNAAFTNVEVKQLLQPGDANTKLRKSAGAGFETVGLSMSPHKSAGVGNTCPFATVGCMSACLDHQGLASVFTTIQAARRRKTQLFYSDRNLFIAKLSAELEASRSRAVAKGLKLAARLNVFSDIAWETTGIVDDFPDIQFYDYTKNPSRAGLIRPNYWVTLSRSESNDAACVSALENANNVAVVFADRHQPYVGNRSSVQKLPTTWNGFKVVDGDTTDLRFDDVRGRKHGRVIGLRLKSFSNEERSNAISSGFPVVWN